jgi:hypothetical protein
LEFISTISYRDPLVGIISLFSIVLLVWLLNYAINRYKSIQKSKQLERFVENFITSQNSSEIEFEKLVSEYPSSAKMLFVLANGYFLSGEYEKSARFLTLILKHTAKNDKDTTVNVMLTLSRSYIRLGFLGRAKAVLIELLHLQPRNEAALKELVSISARTNEYSDSLGATEALSEINNKYSKYADFFHAMMALKNGKLQEPVLDLNPYFTRERAKLLLVNNELRVLFDLASQNNNAKYLTDILWQTYPSDEHMEQIRLSSELSQIFGAKGLLECEKYDSFELEVMSQIHDKNIADLVFKYRCNCCSKEELDYFAICKKCLTLSSCEIEPVLAKKSPNVFSLESFS